MSHAYDDLEMHYLNLEAEVEQHRVGIPTGFYLAWLIRRGWASPELMAHAPALAAGTTTGCELLWDQCDGKLMDWDLTDEGNAFTRDYFEQHYFKDYMGLFGLPRSRPEALYEPDDTPAHAARVAMLLDGRVQGARLGAGFMEPGDLLQRLMDALQARLMAAGFSPSGDYSRSDTTHSFGVQARWPGGVHSLDLGAHVDRKLGCQGLFLDYRDRPEDLLRANRAAWSPDELAAMSAASPLLEVLRLPVQAWMPAHPLLQEAPDLIPRYPWVGGPRFVVRADTPADVEPAIELLGEQFGQHLLPRLPALETLAGVSALKCRLPVDQSPAWTTPLDRSVLACAELAQHPQLGALCDDIERVLRGMRGLPESRPGRAMLSYIATVRARASTRT